jgi:CBS domain-containing protein/uncharacterized protein YkwD
MEEAKIAKIMVGKLVTLSPDNTLLDAIELMQKKHISFLPVVKRSRFVGVITPYDLRKYKHADYHLVFVKDAMGKRLISVRKNTPISEAKEIMKKNNIRGVVVLDKGRLVGVVTSNDIAMFEIGGGIKRANPEKKIGKCSYHLCRRETSLQKCKHCGDYFCYEHINPTPPGPPRFRGTSTEDRIFMEEWNKPGGHPCVPYMRFWEEENKRRDEKYDKALDEAKIRPSYNLEEPSRFVSEKDKLAWGQQLKSWEEYDKKKEQDREKIFLDKFNQNRHEIGKPHKFESEEEKTTRKVLIGLCILLTIAVICVIYVKDNPICISSWSCTEWSTCAYNETQTRACNDSNNCRTMIGKPAESQSCKYDSTKCSDGTAYSECSQVHPYQCVKGLLIENISKCGCAEGYMVSNNTCKLMVCEDGTPYDKCSGTRPLYCLNGSLLNGSRICGCPEGLRAYNNMCIPIVTCSDGTLEPDCSANKPYQCVNGTLIKKASLCGCPDSQNGGYVNRGEDCVYLSEIELHTPDIATLELKIHSLINAQRLNNGLIGLSFDDSLASIARQHSYDMSFHNYFSHISLGGRDPSARATAAGYSCYKNYGSYYTNGIAENIFQTYVYGAIWYTNGIETSREWYSSDEIASQVVDGWMNSPGHRQNILTSAYDKEGIGIAISNQGAVYITEDFC